MSEQRGPIAWEAIRQRAVSSLPTLLGRWLPDGKRRGREWVARNPTRQDRRAGSFQINMQTGRWIDFATEEKGGDPISLYAYLYGLSQGAAARELAGELGLDPTLPRPQRAPLRAPPPDRTDPDDPRAKERRGWAKGIWREARPAAGTLVETYLRGRGVALPVPASLRFAMLRHPDGGEEKRPAMVACMQVGGSVTGVHRTYLAPDGSGKAEIRVTEGRDVRLAKAKLMLGQAEGAAVRLAPLGPNLAIAEGIETALSVLQLAPGWCVWAALSAGNLPAVAIPEGVRRLVYVADGDHKYDPRQRSWRRVGLRKAQEAAEALSGLGIETSIVVPSTNSDMNDTLLHDPELARVFAGYMEGAMWRPAQEDAA